jgi:hemolysin III
MIYIMENALDIREERLNFITHFIGFLLSVVGFAILVVLALMEIESGRIWAHSLYGLTLIAMYGASSWYHKAVCQSKKKRLRKLDHASIYLLIAGSYTPLNVGALLYIVWGIAIVGVLIKLTVHRPMALFSLASYLVMGWLVVLSFPDLIEELSTFSLYGLVIGGLFYTVGTIFYLWESLPYNHGIWHLFVIMGSFSHFCAIINL